jgi:hypothetical protein
MTKTSAVQPAGEHMGANEGPRDLRSRVQIREAKFSDYGPISELQARNGLTTRSYPDWCALWDENPAYLQSNGPRPIGWVLECSKGGIVGFLGNVPLAYTLQGRELAAATGHSWVVDATYRGYSVALLDTFLKQKHVDLFIFATVNAAAESVLRVFGLKRIPVGEWDTARFWITGYKGFANSVMAAHSIPFPTWCSPPLAGALWLRDRIMRPPSIRNTRDVKITVCSEFDHRFQTFWEETRRKNRDRLVAVRDRETLAWHYRSTKCRGTGWTVAASKDDRLVAYWTIDRQDHPLLGLQRLRFVDFQALPGYEDLLQTAVEWTLERCRKDGIHVAEDAGSWLPRFHVTGTTAPYKRRMKSWLFYYLARGTELSEQLRNPAVWTPSSFDGDAST